MNIKETKSTLPKTNPTKEIMGVFIDKIHQNIPNRNGFVYLIVGAPGSGKSSLLLSMFNKKNGTAYYRNKFDNIYLFTPESSYLSVMDHPFANHTNVYHELTSDALFDIHSMTHHK
mgnify:CR=1 FL=1